MSDTSEEYNDLGPSKTQDKRDASAIQQLGEQLMNLKPAQLARLPLTPLLANAIEESTRIKSHEARRRHAQFVGKLMRQAEHASIAAALADLTDPQRKRRLVNWLDQLCNDPSKDDRQALLRQALGWFPHADRQHLRNLMRNLQRSQQTTPAGDATVSEQSRQTRRKLSNYLNELERTAPLNTHIDTPAAE